MTKEEELWEMVLTYDDTEEMLERMMKLARECQDERGQLKLAFDSAL